MIIVGLGNPGQEYANTRHNVGFDVVDKVVDQLGGKWKKEKGVAWCMIGKQHFIKPLQFMNASGQSLQEFMKYKKLALLSSADMLVIHDDLDFPLGEIHEQQNRSAGGHNGVQSMIDALGTQDFSRIRIGIGNNREANIPAEDYVLQHFSPAEQPVIASAITQVVQQLRQRYAPPII
jgi:PTH1 family peptidyl-tRNA hydrolase